MDLIDFLIGQLRGVDSACAELEGVFSLPTFHQFESTELVIPHEHVSGPIHVYILLAFREKSPESLSQFHVCMGDPSELTTSYVATSRNADISASILPYEICDGVV